jgi:hypothetical protein
MNQLLQKQVPVKLATRDYEELRKRVLGRDGWRCQLCGSMTNLEVHHQQFRSQSGADSEDNLITLCTNCHSPIHTGSGGKNSAMQDAFRARAILSRGHGADLKRLVRFLSGKPTSQIDRMNLTRRN